MKITLLSLVILCTSHIAGAQDLNWGNSIGGVNSDICKNIGVDKEGNVYISGYLNDTLNMDGLILKTNGTSDIYIAKYTQHGDLIWAKNVGGPLGDEPEDMYVDDEGNIFITGFFHDAVDFDPGSGVSMKVSKGNADVFVARYTTNGDLVWVETFGGEDEESNDRAYGMSVHPKGYVFITGHYGSDIKVGSGNKGYTVDGFGDWDVFYAKYDINGQKHFIRGFGGLGKDAGRGIEVSKNFDIYISGYFSETVDMDINHPNANLLVSNGANDAFIAKYDIQGRHKWSYGFGGEGDDRAHDISLHQNNNIYITGYYKYSIDLNPQDDLSGTHLGTKFEDIFLAKFNQNGQYKWSHSIGGGLRDVGRTVEVDKAGDVYTTGYYTNDVDFDPSEDDVILDGQGSWDAYFAKYNNSGNLEWAYSIAGPNLDYGFDILPGDGGDFYCAGRFTSETTFGPGGDLTLYSAGVNDAFFAKYSEKPEEPTITYSNKTLSSSSKTNNQWYKDGEKMTGETESIYEVKESGNYYSIVTNLSGEAVSNEIEVELEPENSIKTYPNPSNGRFYLKTSYGEDDYYLVQIINGQGGIVYSKKMNGETNWVNASYLKRGIYTLVITKGGVNTSKTIYVR